MRAVKRGVVPFLTVFAIVLVLSQAGFATQQSGQKVFWMVTAQVPIADLPAYHALAAEELVPLQARHGYNWVASWQTIVGDIEETISVAEFESMDAYLEARQSLLGSAEWAELSPEFGALIRSIRTRLLTATPYSPLQ